MAAMTTKTGEELPNVCLRCGGRYTGDPESLRLGNRLCDGCQRRPRSTCFGHTKHPAHNWMHVTLPLWCPGTDGSNPQVPPALAKEMKEAVNACVDCEADDD